MKKDVNRFKIRWIIMSCIALAPFIFFLWWTHPVPHNWDLSAGRDIANLQWPLDDRHRKNNFWGYGGEMRRAHLTVDMGRGRVYEDTVAGFWVERKGRKVTSFSASGAVTDLDAASKRAAEIMENFNIANRGGLDNWKLGKVTQPLDTNRYNAAIRPKGTEPEILISIIHGPDPGDNWYVFFKVYWESINPGDGDPLP